VAHAGQEIHGQDGFRLLLVRTAAETKGELLEMEATYGTSAQLPPTHLHPTQLERFEVLAGAVRTIVDGAERRYETGESFEVPAGTPHQMTGDGPARVGWQVTPALRTAEFFERLHAAMAAQPVDGAELGALLEEFSAEIQFVSP
jgi:quercetin dioxygenase-like cupin family protein